MFFIKNLFIKKKNIHFIGNKQNQKKNFLSKNLYVIDLSKTLLNI